MRANDRTLFTIISYVRLAICLFIDISHRECPASTIRLSYTTEGEPSKLLKDIKSTREVYFPTIVKTDVAVVVCIKIVAEINAYSSQ